MTPDSGLCKLCRVALPPEGRTRTGTAYVQIHCPRCGSYNLGRMAEVLAPHPSIEPDLYLLSAYTRRQTDREVPPVLVDAPLLSDPQVFESEVRSRRPRGVDALLDNLLTCFADRSAFPGARLELRLRNDYPIAYARNEQEFLYLYNHLISAQLVEDNVATMSDSIHPTLTAAGWRRVRELASVNPVSKQGFVAMSFADNLLPVYQDGILPVETPTGYRLLRIDRKEHNDRIDDQIISEIRRSRFLIADVTGQRAGVYFEAGFAMGLGLPVIWACSADDKDNVHFDTRQYNHIFWKSATELRDALTNRILATIGHANGGLRGHA